MKFNSILLLLTSITLFISCSEKGFEKAENKTEYLAEMNSVSESSMKSSLQKDSDYIKNLIKEVEGYEFYFTMSFGFGDGGTKEEIDTAQSFSLPNVDSVRFDFQQLKNNLFAEQRYRLPQSQFDFTIDPNHYSFPNLSNENMKYEIIQAYSGTKSIDSKNIKLQHIDSLNVKATYEFPTSFDTLEIDISAKDSLIYKGFTIEIDTIASDRVGLKIPFELYQDLIGRNGISKDGITIDDNSYSAYPVMGIAPKILKELQSVSKIMEEAMKTSGKENALKILEKIPESSFVYKNKINEYIQEIKGFDNMDDKEFSEITKMMREFEEKFAEILFPIYQTVEISFPNEISKVYFYIADSKEKISQNLMAYNDFSARDEIVFYDESKGKFGIMDKNANIIIPAEYDELYPSEDQYYTVYKDTISAGYFLDLKNKKMEKLPDDVKFFKKLNDEYSAFKDENDYVGVLKNRKEQLVPYEFDDVDLVGNIFVMKRSKRGRSFYEFRKMDGSKIEIPEKVTKISFHKNIPNIVLITRDEKFGLINKEGKLTIPLSDTPIDVISPDLIYFAERDEYGGEILGIKDISGKIIANPKFYNLGYAQDDRISFSIFVDGEKKFGYLNSKIQQVIAPTYSKALDFYKGMAMVEKDEKIYLIDTSGKIIKNIPTDPQIGTYLHSEMDNGKLIYIVNDELYDYQGNLLK